MNPFEDLLPKINLTEPLDKPPKTKPSVIESLDKTKLRSFFRTISAKKRRETNQKLGYIQKAPDKWILIVQPIPLLLAFHPEEEPMWKECCEYILYPNLAKARRTYLKLLKTYCRTEVSKRTAGQFL